MANAFDVLKDIENGADGTVKKISSFSSTGRWTITGVEIGKPLYILGTADPEYSSYSYFFIEAVSGTDDAKMIPTGDEGVSYLIGAGNTGKSTNCMIVIPTSSTVVFEVSWRQGEFTANAYQ